MSFDPTFRTCELRIPKSETKADVANFTKMIKLEQKWKPSGDLISPLVLPDSYTSSPMRSVGGGGMGMVGPVGCRSYEKYTNPEKYKFSFGDVGPLKDPSYCGPNLPSSLQYSLNYILGPTETPSTQISGGDLACTWFWEKFEKKST